MAAESSEALARCRYWMDNMDAETRMELSGITDRKELEDRFYKDLEFGTGGMRGLMGAGTNRMNRYTVGRAAAGFAMYLNERGGGSVAIAYDTRKGSREFACTAANVLEAYGIGAQIIGCCPTPVLSCHVRAAGTAAGIMITASHNPKEYNGLKIYDGTGCQLVPRQAEEVTRCIAQVPGYLDADCPTVHHADEECHGLLPQYTNSMLCAFGGTGMLDCLEKSKLKVVYTPLHGTGYRAVQDVLGRRMGAAFSCVEAQNDMDGSFPSVVSPNPEDRRALLLGIAQAEAEGADIVIGNDPDADRVGAAVRTAEGFKLVTGNQMGALLLDYLLPQGISHMKNPAVVTTVVTSPLGARIAEKHGVKVIYTLTGFKYIGEKMNQFEAARKAGDAARAYDFLFGYEESYGYLFGTHARDKDGVSAALLICCMAAELKMRGKTLADRLEEIYSEYGYFLDAQDSYALTGKDGQERIAEIMKELRSGPLEEGVTALDFLPGVDFGDGFGPLPGADVLSFTLRDGSRICVRPSGTEPKIKIYYSIQGEGREACERRCRQLSAGIKEAFGL